MAEWEEKLGAILNNPEAMSQIMALAQSLNGAGAGQTAAAPAQTAPPAAPGAETPEAPSPAAPSPEGEGGGLDPRLMEMGLRALAAYQDPNNTRAALLAALRPFVKPERYAKVDKAIQIAKLSKVVRAALEGFQGGEGAV